VHLDVILVNDQLEALFLHAFMYLWNKYIEKQCSKLVINQNCVDMHGQQNIKFCDAKQAKQIYKYENIKTILEAWNKYIEEECVKLVINQNYM
jgi:hypothetical protein